MKRMLRFLTGPYMFAALCTVLLLYPLAHGFNGQTFSSPQPREVSEPVTSQAPQARPGLLAWLDGLLPRGLRFNPLSIGSSNQSQVIAAANCFQSGAGISCQGFKNLEEYLAAVRASENLGIPFGKLQGKMKAGMTLHQAIKELRPGVNSRYEAMRAEAQARKLLKDFSSSS